MRAPRLTALFLTTIVLATSTLCFGQRRKKTEEEMTQTLDIPRDPPSAVVADTHRLTFHVAPLSAKGLLSQQVRDGLRALMRQARGSQIVKVRAFVAGTGDMRRVQAIVSEVFTERHQPIPAVTVAQVGAIPMEGAQVVLEAIASARKPTNPNGLAWMSGQLATADEPILQVAPLVERSLQQMETALAGIGLAVADVLRVTCYLSAFGDVQQVQQNVAARFPQAGRTIVQLHRAPSNGLAECEGVARLRQSPGQPVKLVNPSGLPTPEAYSQVALIDASKIVISGSQLAFGSQEDDVRLAFQRLDRTLEALGAGLRDTAVCRLYPLHSRTAELIRKVRFEFFDQPNPPASTLVYFEGLPSLDASFAIDVIAVPAGR